MTTDPKPEAVDIVERTIRDFGSIDAGNKPQRVLAAYDILMALAALDSTKQQEALSAKPLDGDAMPKDGRALELAKELLVAVESVLGRGDAGENKKLSHAEDLARELVELLGEVAR
jgi:hypothetical protein